MSSSDQPSADEIKAQAAAEQEQPVPTAESEAFQPLYEFPAAQPASGQPELVYPPPPSYYQNLPVQPERPPVPLTSAVPPLASAPLRPAQATPLEPRPLQAALPQPQQPQAGIPPYPPPGMPPYPPPYGAYGQQPPVKKSYRWVWILVSVLGVLLLAGCGICGWGAYSIFNSTYRQVSGAVNVVNDFYSNLQAANYTAAYSDLAPQGQIIGLTEAQFTGQASKLDSSAGPVTSFVLGQPTYATNAGTGPDLSRFTITVSVKRTHLSYTALLTVQQIGGTWKITEYDRL